MDKDFPQHYITWVMHGEMNILPNSRNIEVAQDAPPFENPIELFINEVFGSLRHETVNAGPSQVAGEEETLHDLSSSTNKDYFEFLKDGSEDLYEGSKYLKLEFLLKLYHEDDINEESFKYCHTSRWKLEKDRNLDHAPSTRLDSDGFNLFGSMSTNYNIWPSLVDFVIVESGVLLATVDSWKEIIKFRLMRHHFNGNMEDRAPPKKLFGSQILQQVKDINVTFGRQSEETLFDKYRHATQAGLPYYGKLEDIIELKYYGQFRVVPYKFQWVDTTRNRGFKIDAWKFNCVNFSKLIHTGDCVDDDPYIEASQVNMVYYVDDENDKEWSMAVHLKPRDLFDIGEVDEEEIY
ncbi:hypothetical protein FXO37_22823 [Capsicum annuum]|nr:hypothetical protein FXO37_22823 [Capsicum annuum]